MRVQARARDGQRQRAKSAQLEAGTGSEKGLQDRVSAYHALYGGSARWKTATRNTRVKATENAQRHVRSGVRKAKQRAHAQKETRRLSHQKSRPAVARPRSGGTRGGRHKDCNMPAQAALATACGLKAARA